MPDDFAERFKLLEVDARKVVQRSAVVREGQGAFRSRLIDAYEGRCAITGERTELVLGPSGKLRAPTLLVGDAVIVGFNLEVYEKTFG